MNHDNGFVVLDKISCFAGSSNYRTKTNRNANINHVCSIVVFGFNGLVAEGARLVEPLQTEPKKCPSPSLFLRSRVNPFLRDTLLSKTLGKNSTTFWYINKYLASPFIYLQIKRPAVVKSSFIYFVGVNSFISLVDSVN